MKKDGQEQDRTLEHLLGLHGDIYVIDDQGHWVKFEVHRVAVDPERPHGIKYSLTLHDGKSNKRLIGFDNAHVVPQSKGPGGKSKPPCDHCHRHETVKRYKYENAAKLIEDFWKLVDQVLKENK